VEEWEKLDGNSSLGDNVIFSYAYQSRSLTGGAISTRVWQQDGTSESCVCGRYGKKSVTWGEGKANLRLEIKLKECVNQKPS